MSKLRLLLLNTSNHPIRLAYPYAFVQVSEVARRFGIEVSRVDLFGVPPAARAEFLRRHLEQVDPQLVGVTLRNTDSLLSVDYTRRKEDSDYARPFQRNVLEQLTLGLPPYYPTHDTRDLIALLRSLTRAPIMLGGFGFSVQPELLMKYLAPDFGVVGDAEPVFARIEDVLARRNLGSIDNLSYFDGHVLRTNQKVFVGPSPNREYVDDIIADRARLFGALSRNLPATSRAIPIEVMRGCPFRCTFCSEPVVKGSRAVFRDLDVVEDELEFLRTHGLNVAWFVCSEINALGNGFALELAERLIRINERRSESERIKWFTYYLLKFSLDELRTLRRSGFYGGWNDIPSFDDQNLKALQVPYRSKHLLQSIKDVHALRAEEAESHGVQARTLDESIFYDPEHRAAFLPEDMLTSPTLTLFLGNQHATIETVRTTLAAMDREGLAQNVEAAFVIRGERVFDYNRDAGNPRAPSLSFDPKAPPAAAANHVNPTFRFSQALVEQVGSLDALEEFFIYVEDTFLSRNHLFRKDWNWLLASTLAPPALHGLWLEALSTRADPLASITVAPVRDVVSDLATNPSVEKLRALLFPVPGRRHLANAAADMVIRYTLANGRGGTSRVLHLLGIPHDRSCTVGLSELGLMTHLFAKFRDEAELRNAVEGGLFPMEDPHDSLMLADLLYRHNVRLRPEYRPFFEKSDSQAQVAGARSRRIETQGSYAT